jgi:hypothetical protein
LGRPPKTGREKLNPGDCNPIEGKFGQGKVRYGLGLIKASLQGTSESWVASIIMVMNLIRMANQAALVYCLFILRNILRMVFGIYSGNRRVSVGGLHPIIAWN